MSSVGRGRGYTGRYHHREDPPRPGELDKLDPLTIADMEVAKKLSDMTPRSPDPKTVFKDEEVDEEDDQVLMELLLVDEQFKPLLVLLEQFNPGEDGIQFNRKLKQFESTVNSMCPDEPRLLNAFATFRAAALTNSATARKLASVGASFTRQQRQQLFRTALLNVVMQGTFYKLEVLSRSSNPSYLINAANLLGDYFAEARLCNGNKVHVIAPPLLQYMKALLASDDIRAHRSLATQLMQNGRELLTILSQELDDLSIAIKDRLQSQPPVKLIWLLLSADLCLNKFLPLPNHLQQYYASHLNLSADEQANYSEVSYGTWKKSPEKEDFNSSLGDSTSELNVSTEKVNQSLTQLNINQDDSLDMMKPKLRPILGAGAGLLKQDKCPNQLPLSASQDSFDTWSKSSLSKRYDLNSWRQNGEEPKEEEPVFNPAVPPPNIVPQFPPTLVPDYPPPTLLTNANPRLQQQPNPVPQAENFIPPNYLQQGDGKFIQNQYNERFNTNAQFSQGDGIFIASQQFQNQNIEKSPPPANTNPTSPETYTEPKSTSADRSKRPVENWRKDKEVKDDQNKNPNFPRQKSWSRQKSKDSLSDPNEDKNGERVRCNSRNSREGRPNRPKKKEETPEPKPARRHVTDVPRGQKYWDHDDRCDKDYNS